MAVSEVGRKGSRALNTRRDARISQHAAVAGASSKSMHIPVAKHRAGARGGSAAGSWGASRGVKVQVGALGRLDEVVMRRTAFHRGSSQSQATGL